jgi:predicted permease
MRMALGAGRTRLVRRLLCESLLLSLVGSAAGLLVALAGSRLLVRLIQTRGERVVVDLTPDLHVLAFTAGAALLTALIFGLTPAVRATRIRLNDVLKEGARNASQGSRRLWLGKAIVGGQVALSLTLLAGAALFLSTLQNLGREDLGFDPDRVLTVQVDLEKAVVPKEQRIETLGRMLQGIRAAPGVESAAQSWRTPVSNPGWNDGVTPEGYTPRTRDEAMMWFNSVSPGYFETLHTSLLAGRDFGPGDVAGSPAVMIIDDVSARRYWGDENPVGKIIDVGGGPSRQGGRPVEVIGVVKAAKYREIHESRKALGFYPAAQAKNPRQVYFLVRAAGPAADLAPVVKSAIEAVNPLVSMQFGELDVQVAESMTQHRLVATLSAAFAGLAGLLAVVGLYGVTAYTAARRRGEIGIRIALGAQPTSVIWLMVRDLAVVLTIGLALGWGASIALSQSVESLLFGVEPGDPRLFALATLILAGVSGSAAFIPAWRASKLQPIAVLREE